jgi:ribosomal protein L15
LRRANGANGKFAILNSLCESDENKKDKKRKLVKIDETNEKMNKIVHSGEFASKNEVKAIAKNAEAKIDEIWSNFRNPDEPKAWKDIKMPKEETEEN